MACCNHRSRLRSVTWGLFLIALGAFFLLSNLGYLRVEWRQWWPLWLIGYGVMLLLFRAGGWDRGSGDNRERSR